MNRIRSAVRGLFDFLVRCWTIEAYPVQVLRVRRAEAPKMTLISPAEENALLEVMEAQGAWAARRDAPMVRVLLTIGIRLSSLVGIDAEDIDLAHGRLTVRVKGGRVQDVSLDPELGQALLDHARGQKGPPFRSGQGKRISQWQVQLRFSRWRQMAGMREEITVHGLRHAFGTRLYQRTRDLRRVQGGAGAPEHRDGRAACGGGTLRQQLRPILSE